MRVIVSLNAVLQYNHIIKKKTISECSGNAFSFYFPGGLKHIVGSMKLVFHGFFHRFTCTQNTKKVSYTEFVYKELVSFSNSNNELSSIPCLVDG